MRVIHDIFKNPNRSVAGKKLGSEVNYLNRLAIAAVCIVSAVREDEFPLPIVFDDIRQSSLTLISFSCMANLIQIVNLDVHSTIIQLKASLQV